MFALPLVCVGVRPKLTNDDLGRANLRGLFRQEYFQTLVVLRYGTTLFSTGGATAWSRLCS